MSTTIVHLVRHGEVFNPERVLYGRLPGYHLSERGRRQALATANSFRGHDIATIVSSPLLRTRETAAPLADITGLEVTTDPRLIEAGNRFEGLHVNSWRSELWKPVHWPLLRHPRVPSWGEPYEDIADRMLIAIEDIRSQAEGREAVAVTHQLPIVCVQRRIRGLALAHNPRNRECNLASVTSLVFRGDQLDVLVYTEPARYVTLGRRP